MPSKEPLLLGIYAWTLTIASPSFESRVSTAVRLSAALVLTVLVAGWLALERFPRLADSLGVFAFSALSVCTLKLLGPGALGIRAPIVQLTMGAVVWCLFSISWARARNVSRRIPAQISNTLDMTLAPADPLASQLAIGILGFCSAGIIAIFGAPGTDGHGALIVGLIIVGALRLTAMAGALISRIERAAAKRQPAASVSQHRD